MFLIGSDVPDFPGESIGDVWNCFGCNDISGGASEPMQFLIKSMKMKY